MSLKSALFEMKEGLVNPASELAKEQFIHELEIKNNLGDGSLVWYFNQMTIIERQSKELTNQQKDSKKVNRKWSKREIDFILRYISERQEEWGANITEILDEAATLLNRGYQSVNYKYYSLIKSKHDNFEENKNYYQIMTIKQKSIPVVSTEIVPFTSILQESNDHDEICGNEDISKTFSELVANMQKLPGFNLNEIIVNLYHLSNLALQNQKSYQEIEVIKSLQEKLAKTEQRLILERKRNDELQLDVSKLAKEIRAFNQLGDTAKIQNLKSYNQKLSYIIEGFGLIHKVGS